VWLFGEEPAKLAHPRKGFMQQRGHDGQKNFLAMLKLMNQLSQLPPWATWAGVVPMEFEMFSWKTCPPPWDSMPNGRMVVTVLETGEQRLPDVDTTADTHHEGGFVV
jgi:hypothetical protein